MPRTKHSLSTNPIRQVREQLGLSLDDMSKAIGCHLQALYMNESGVYPSILPEILHWLVGRGYNRVELLLQYDEFVDKTRESFRNKYYPYELPKPDALRCPLRLWRESLGISRAGLAKGLCVQPSLLYRVEQGKAQSLPSQLRQALLYVGMTKEDVNELNYRTAEFSCR